MTKILIDRKVLEHAVYMLEAAVIANSLPEIIQSRQYALAHALQAILDVPSEPKRKNCTLCGERLMSDFTDTCYSCNQKETP